MTWSAPMTAVSGAVFAAADFNQYVRDNLNSTAVALATAAGQFFVSKGANSLEARTVGSGTVATSQTTTSTSYTNLATIGPAATVTTGALALVIVSAAVSNTINNASSFMSYEVSGATTSVSNSSRALRFDGLAAGNVIRASAVSPMALTPGSNTFTAKYAVGSGTGTFQDRSIVVIPLG